MSNYAWVTLATNDSYSLGALVVVNSLKKVNTIHQTAVLITPGVSESMKIKLQASFNVVVEVNVLDSQDAANLALLSRPELGVTFTKLHSWRLIQFEKCVFLDADTFVLQNCDELFDREELSAAPDVGWPDCFNSGVFVFRPSLDTFGKLIEFATKQGSFDGGDQGLLNSFFSDWAHKDISKHLPFIYNTCSTACYSYLPAFKQFGQNVKILHFIGQVKPWLLNFDSSSQTAYAPQGYGHLGEFLQQWWNVFCADVHPALTTEMTANVHREYSYETQWYQNIICPNQSSIQSCPNPPHIEFFDPWDAFYQTNADQNEFESHYRSIDAHNVEYSHTELNHESIPNPHNNCEVHQSSHDTNANVDLQHTIDAPHISIRSSSIEESNEILSISNTHENCEKLGDKSSHSINKSSFLTVNHDNAHADFTVPVVPSLSGYESLDIGEQERDDCHNETYDGDIEDVNDDEITDTCEEGGLAGALAQLTLGAPRSAQQQAYEESMRRQCWEAGNIDYLGKDSFDNIWKRITKTIETKTETPQTEKNRSPTPQPEEKLAVETKKEVKVGATFNESEEDVLATAQTQEQIITEVTADGRIIQKKIVTYPAEETTEIEEIEEVDGQTMSVKRSVIGSPSTAAQSTSKAKTLAEIKSEPIVLVPGYKTVEIDEKTNSTIVTEKTTTGYQQTITTTQEDGTKKIQTKTFYDPVEIPGEEVEEETYEETESFEPGTAKTTVSTVTETKDGVKSIISNINTGAETTEIKNVVETSDVVKKEESHQDESKESQNLTDLKNQPIVIIPGHQKVEFDQETNTTTVTEKTTTGYQQTITAVTSDGRKIVQTKVFYDSIPSEQVEEEETTTTTITEVSDSPTPAKNISETVQSAVKQEVQEQSTETVKQPDVHKDTKDTTAATTDVKDLQLVPAAGPTGPTSLTQKKTTAGGKEIEVTAVVSEDGKTKTLRKTTRQPAEEIEIEEYEETQSYEPGEVKVITTKRTIPLTEAHEDAAKDIGVKSENVVDTPKEVTSKKQAPPKIDSSIETTIEEEVKSERNVSAKLTTTEKKKTTTAVKPASTESKQTTTAKQVAKPTTTNTKQITTEAKQTTTEAKETTTEAKQSPTGPNKIATEAKQSTNEAKRTATEAKQTLTEAKKIATDNVKKTTSETKQATTEAKQNITAAKQTTTSIKQTSTQALTPGQTKTVTKQDQTDSSVKKLSKTTPTSKKEDETQTQSKSAGAAKTDKASTEGEIVGTPKVTTKDGETTTEIVRRIPGGTDHTWTTVRADGSTKKESKKFFDVVELSSEEEEEIIEYEEVIDDDDDDTPPVKITTTKTQRPGAVSVKGLKTPTITEATPPNTPPLKLLVIGSTSADLKAEHEIPDTPPLDKVEQLRKKKLQSAPASKVAPKVDKPAAEAPKAPPRKKEVKKPATGK